MPLTNKRNIGATGVEGDQLAQGELSAVLS